MKFRLRNFKMQWWKVLFHFSLFAAFTNISYKTIVYRVMNIFSHSLLPFVFQRFEKLNKIFQMFSDCRLLNLITYTTLHCQGEEHLQL